MTYTTTRKKIRSEVNSQVYTGPHNGLAGRDAANAHPMQSITGLEAELASIQSHIGDVDIHYAMDQISITESQISDLQAYLTLAGGAVDFLDVTNDLAVGGNVGIKTNPHNDIPLLINRPGGVPSIKAHDAFMIIDSAGTQLRLNHWVDDDICLASGGGDVIIGSNATPVAKLEVRGDVRIVDDDLTVVGNGQYLADVASSTNTISKMYLRNNATGNNTGIALNFGFSTISNHFHNAIRARRTNLGGSHASSIYLCARRAVSQTGEGALDELFEVGYNNQTAFGRMYGGLQVDNNLTVGGDTILSALAGGGTRTLKIDNNGKVFAE